MHDCLDSVSIYTKYTDNYQAIFHIKLTLREKIELLDNICDLGFVSWYCGYDLLLKLY